MEKFFITLSNQIAARIFRTVIFLLLDKTKGRQIAPTAFLQYISERLHHSAHSAAVAVATACRSFFWFVSDYTFCCQQQACDRCCVFKSQTRYFLRVNDTSFQKVCVNI